MKRINWIKGGTRTWIAFIASLADSVAVPWSRVAWLATLATGLGGLAATAQDGSTKVDGAAESSIPATYSAAVMALKPIGYWPLDETAPISVDVAGNSSTLGAAINGTYLNGTDASRTTPYETLVLGKNPVAYYRLGEAAYTVPVMPTAVNLGSLGTAANGTYGAGTFPGAAGATPMPGLGANNFACRFDGTGQINCGSDNGLNVDQISIAAWIKTDGVLRYMNILAKGGLLWRLNMNAGSNQLLWTCPGGGTTGTRNVADGAWHHVVAVAGSAGSALYVDGLLDASGPAISAIADNADPVLIGSQGNASLYRWKGSLDEVALFNTALTAQQVADLYLAAEPPVADILTFGPGALINGTNISWTAPHGSNVKALAPVFTLAPGSSCDHVSGTPYDFSSPVIFKVTASDLTTKTYTVTATVDPQPATLANTFNLGTSGNGTFFEGGSYHSWIAKGVLPPGSFLRSVAIDATLESTDNSNWAAELMVLCDPTPGTPGGDGLLEIGPDYINLGSAQRAFWSNGFTGPVSTVTDTKTAGVDFSTGIDLGSVGLLLVNGYGGPVTGGTWSGTVTVTYEIASPSLILTFGLPGNPGAINQTAKSITLTVPEGSDVTALAPTYTVSPFATGNPTSGTARNFSTPQTYTITAQDGSTTVYTVTVSVVGGLRVKTFDATYGSYYLNPIANLMALSPSATSTQVDDIDYGDFVAAFPGLTSGDTFTILWEGWFDVSKDGPGLYTFGTNSDDGSVVFLDLNGDGDFADPGEMIVDNNWNHAPQALTGTVMLGMDAVRIAIGFFEEAGGEAMAAGFKKGDRIDYAALDPINGTSGHFFSAQPAGSPAAANVWNFGVSGYPAAIHGATIAWPLPPGTNVSALAPTFAVSSGASAVPPSGTVRNFTAPQTYAVTARDGSVKTYTVTAAAAVSDGLIAKTFDNTFGTSYLDPISNLMALTPSGTSKQFGNVEVTCGNFAPLLPGLTGNDTFSILWEGWFDVSKDGPGTYTFGLESDDGAVIYLDLNDDGDFADAGERIVDNNRNGYPLIRTGEVTLARDAVRIAIGYFEIDLIQTLTARFKKGAGLDFIALDPITGSSGHFFSAVPPANPSAANLWDFGLPGNPAVMTETSVVLTVPYGSDVTALAPTFTTSTGAGAVPPSGSVRNFATPQTYTVTSANGLTTKTYTVTVIITPTWIRDASGLWSATTNWGGGNVANGSGAIADFNSVDLTADRTVSLDSPRTIGKLIFGDTTPASAAGWILSNNGSAANILTLAGGAPAIVVNTLGSGKSVTISAQLAGTLGLTKSGAGMLTLTNTNTYSGGTLIQAGVLQVGSGGLSGSLGYGPVTNNATLVINRTGTLALADAITGTGGIVKRGTGTLSLDAANTFAGGMRIEQGTVLLKGGGWYAGNATGSGPVTVKPGATLVNWNVHSYGGGNAPANDLLLEQGTFQLNTETYFGDLTMTAGIVEPYPGTLTGGDLRTTQASGGSVITTLPAPAPSEIRCMWSLYASAAANIADGTADPDLMVSGAVAGSGNLAKLGPGTLTLTGTNTYTGNTTVAGGSLVLADNAALKFVVTNSSNNRLTGTGTATLNGDFIIDTSAVTATYGAWALVDVATLTETFGATFTPAGTGWSESANVWTKLDGTKVWTFSEATGILALYIQGNQAAVWTGGGGGTWNTTATNWSGVTGTPWNAANGPGNTAQFAKAGDAATLSGSVVAGTLQFNQSATLSGPGTLRFGTTVSSMLVAVANGRTATISADFVGAAVAASQGNKIAKTGSGTLVLAGATNLVTGDADVTLAAGYTVEGGGILQVTGALKAASRSQTTALGQPNFRNLVGAVSAGNALIVNGSGSVISGGIDIGYSTFGNNSVTISSPGTQALPSYVIIGRNQTLAIGGASSNNNLTINNGAYLLYSNGGGTQTLTLGTNAGANNNAILVDGAGSTLDRVNAGGFAQPGGFPGATGGAITVGVLGSNNRLTVSNGGNILPRRISVGEGGSNNAWVVTRGATGASADGTNAVFQVGSASGATDNSFVISEAGKYFFNGTATTRICAVGTVAGAHNNILRIAGANSQFNINHAVPLTIGGTAINNVITNGGSGNRLDILDGGTLVSTAPVILAGGSAANRTVFNLGNGIGSTAEAIVGASLAQSNSYYVNQSILGNTLQVTNRWDAGGQTFSPGVNLATTNTVLCINNGRLAAGQGASMLAAPLVAGVGTVDLGGPAFLSIPTGQTAAITPAITGVGSLIKEGAGALAILGVNTYTGNTTVAGGTLVLADNAALRFVLTDNANNLLAGSGDAIVNGDFIIDTTAVTATTGAWTLVDVTSLKATFGATFAITGAGWSEKSNVWTRIDGMSIWTFTEATGVLALVLAKPDLTDLDLSAGTLVPGFGKLTTSYLATVPFAIDSITVTPVTEQPTASVRVNGVPVASGTASGAIHLAVGNNPVITLVTAANGITTRTYAIMVTRLPENFVLGSANDAPVTADGFAAGGYPVNLTLNDPPAPGTILTIVNNTGLGFIHGAFANLAQGQRLTLNHGGIAYDFVANYFGGTGNDLVLQWADARVVAWGSNSFGQLGDNSTTCRLLPTAVDDTGVLAGKTILAVAGGYLHSLALCSDGTLAAWGYNVHGQLGNNGTGPSSVPVAVDRSRVLADKTVIGIAAGPFHNLALCSDGTVVAWGYNNYGQLGTGDTLTRRLPVRVAPAGALAGKQVVAVAAAAYASFALCADGTLAAWGYNDEGELGDGTTANSPVPVAVDTSGALAGKRIASLSAGQYHTLALCTDGTLVAWGYNHRGQLGNGGTDSTKVPTVIGSVGALAGKSVVSTRASGAHSMALCADGTLAAWGWNNCGQLGVDGITQSSVPVLVGTAGGIAGGDLTQVALGGSHSLALCADGSLAAWGGNANGQLGNNCTTSSALPVAVDRSGWVAGARGMMAASGSAAYHNLAIIGLPSVSVTRHDARLQGSAGIDSDQDGVADLIEYAFGLHLTANHGGQLPQVQRIGGNFVMRFTQPAGVTGITYGAEWSTTLLPGSWTEVTDTGTGEQHIFSVPLGAGAQGFMRLKVTRQ